MYFGVDNKLETFNKSREIKMKFDFKFLFDIFSNIL